ncbi:GntR family transcriptional regulator [Novosphingobium endophyticum]|uniref:GntR family transcriptional regulator n=1 Tax=Novosphingobium endophyticum TaxID=1955250 RepID=A0A916X5K6_9SPHN|nr:FCD domain-containing protein [Novosphingobium endophyticum]GGC01358.1 GntR family transcriptional regulator [Novosphingobium endophyticum]
MTIADAPFDRLCHIIESHEREGTMRLPPEARLAETVGVTRARLRTLLKRAERDGLIWRHVGKGTFAGSRPIVSEDAARALSVSADDLFDARLLLEPQLAAQAALHSTDRDIAAMYEVLDAMVRAGSFQEWKRLDARLHRLIAMATQNALLLMLHESLHVPIRVGIENRLEEVFDAPPVPRVSTNEEHRAIVDAIAGRNAPLAQQLMRDHIGSVRDQLFATA